jgi:hypothetical protein
VSSDLYSKFKVSALPVGAELQEWVLLYKPSHESNSRLWSQVKFGLELVRANEWDIYAENVSLEMLAGVAQNFQLCKVGNEVFNNAVQVVWLEKGEVQSY